MIKNKKEIKKIEWTCAVAYTECSYYGLTFDDYELINTEEKTKDGENIIKCPSCKKKIIDTGCLNG